MSPKKYNTCHKDVQKEAPKKCWFGDFSGSHPSMVPRASPGPPRQASRTQTHIKMDAQTWFFCCFMISISHSLETLCKCFVCSMNNNSVIFSVQCMLRGDGAGCVFFLVWGRRCFLSVLAGSLMSAAVPCVMDLYCRLLPKPGCWEIGFRQIFFKIVILYHK